MQEGRIVKALSGFYYVQSNSEIYTCKGRGVFRKKKITPLVGDVVKFDITNPKEGYITEIEPRKNSFSRPPIANVNQAAVVSSATMPDFNTTLLDRFLIVFEANEITPFIFITKIDLLSTEELERIKTYKKDYEQIGYTVELVVSKEGSNLAHLKHYFDNEISVITGQSGVGKSSILNAMNPSLLIETDEISTSLGRGKHTTRHVELISVGQGLVADTPGFSALELTNIELDQIGDCFPEMRERKSGCRFRGCLHHKEPHCAIKRAVDQGEIKRYRYENYLQILEEIQTRKVKY